MRPFVADLTWIKGPELNWEIDSVFYSCAVQLNYTTSMFVGGNGMEFDSWLLNWKDNSWTTSGELNEGRLYHSCAILEGKGVLVAGGVNNNFDPVTSVELYDPSTGKWIMQPSLPEDVTAYYLSLHSWGNTVIALFDGEDHVYQYGDDGTWSMLDGVVLSAPYSGFNGRAVLVDDYMALGCI